MFAIRAVLATILLLVAQQGDCVVYPDCSKTDSKMLAPTEETQIFGAQSPVDCHKALIFFPKTRMCYFQRLSVTSGLVFLNFESDANTVLYEFKMDNNHVECISNNNYCYVKVPVERKDCPCEYRFSATLRGRHINGSEICGPERCPNMRTPANCHVTMTDPSPTCKPVTSADSCAGAAATRRCVPHCHDMPEDLQRYIAANPPPSPPPRPPPPQSSTHSPYWPTAGHDHHYLFSALKALCAAALVPILMLVAIGIVVLVWMRRRSQRCQRFHYVQPVAVQIGKDSISIHWPATGLSRPTNRESRSEETGVSDDDSSNAALLGPKPAAKAAAATQ